MRPGRWGESAVQAVQVDAYFGVLRRPATASATSSMFDPHPAHPHRSPASSCTLAARSDRASFASTPNPLSRPNHWPPAQASQVSVSVGDGAGVSWTIFTGEVEQVDGSITSPVVDVSAVDLLGRLDAPMEDGTDYARAFVTPSPPHPGGGSADWRYGPLCSMWQVDRAARRGGFYASATPRWGTRLAVPMMGGLHADFGELYTSRARGTDPEAMGIVATDWGAAISNFDATWLLSSPIPAGTTSEMVLDLPTRVPTDGQAVVTLLDSASDTGFFVVYRPSDDMIRAGTYDPALTTLITVSRDGASRVAIRVRRDSLSLRVEGASSGVTAPAFTARPAGWSPDRVAAGSDGPVAGIEVAENPTVWSTLNSRRTARLRMGTVNHWSVARHCYDMSARQVLEAIADAELAQWWIDREGVLQWAGIGVLESAPVVATLSTADRLEDASWSYGRDGLARSVRLEWQQHAVQRRQRPSVALSHTGATDLEHGVDIHEAIVAASDDEDWINPDSTLTRADGSASLSTLMGGSVAALSQTPVAGGDDSYWDTTSTVWLERLTQRAFKWTIGPFAGATWRVHARVPESATGVGQWWPGQDGLVLRGYGKVTWAQRTETATQTSATIGVAEHVHDCSYYVQTPAFRSHLRSFLVAEMSKGLPTFTVRVKADPRFEVGDRVLVRDSARTGVEVVGIIQSDQSRWRPGDGELEVTIRPQSWTVDESVAQTPAPHWLQT